ncbi:uncharacterized protein PODANS_5_7870 [Podospora anserina S mat+]|uniref:Podospora anserina S mat+ genomic DNA chromosome 5, supercontig 9 n=1 Tax=Podospora anserina (strain S / ATCC MYA-4624 / DSM 980 / FGSC 10383) TaxID=515849 RepID=B2AKP9_PODAN|nr:uncharacterized protein PODANS_5_7870 [Podospora anserina S mat+]CAP64502.1 unnamed protein product [Podospora anserina S mat+]CDP29899.1 Putative protein of unknown function [Podospora anserina S mat+]
MAWLIDAKKQCLVPAKAELQYVALSYVWGQAAMLRTERANLLAHQNDRVFDRLRARDIYGSLCIVHEEGSKHTRIRDMAKIYENTRLTIVAGDGLDADHGLRGIPNVSQPRQLHPELELSDTISVRAPQNLALEETTWARRGWTWQELQFSQRRLTFVDGSVRWRCAESFFCEDDVFPARDYRKTTESIGDLNEPNLDNVCRSRVGVGAASLTDLGKDISTFNQRSLTYDEDALLAFEGTLAIYIEHQFPRGFLHGIPVSLLDSALLRHTQTTVPFAEVRQASSHSRECPPRWGWSGWKGKILQCWEGGLLGQDNVRPPQQTISILTWKLRCSVTSTPVKIPFQND